jgi:hypothetical protein
MPFPELERLVATGLLEREAAIRGEFEGLIREAGMLLRDAHNKDLSLESRFHLAYSAAHSIALAALRWHGYRPRNNRQVVFQALAHTMNTPAATWRMLARSHAERNKQEYEGAGEITEALFRDLLKAADMLLEQARQLRLPDEAR